MKMVKKSILILSLLTFSMSTSTMAKEEKVGQLQEMEEVYRLLFENHVSKPTEKQLVQGALKLVSQQVRQSANKDLTFSQEDDSLPELETRLQQWQGEYQLKWETVNDLSINGMISSLNDPHTAFFTKEELRRFQDAVNNQFVGFGLRFLTNKGNFIVKEIIAGSPAAQADIKPGDILYAIDGEQLKGKSFEEAYSYLKGEAGTSAVLSIYKPQQKQMKQINIARAEISIPEVTGNRFQENIGFIRIDTFGADTGYEFQHEFQKLRSTNPPLKGLVLDLRDNGGGYLSSARDVASMFMEDGLLMYTTNRNGIELETWVHNGEPITYPVRILVNENTASASELLSGALVDHRIAKLVGTQTYGKGSAQQVVPLADGDALKITLNEYFTPTHRVVNRMGLQPEIIETDDIAQVIVSLRSLGVKRFDIRESEIGKITVNGLEFFSASPIFKGGAKGYMVRANILASLTGKPAPKENNYVFPPPTATSSTISVTVSKNKDGVILKSIMK